jgi:hypothetical protein
MTATDLKNLLQRVETWPEEAQDELIAVAEIKAAFAKFRSA